MRNIFLGLFLFLAVGGGVYVFTREESSNTISPSSERSEEQDTEVATDETISDSAGGPAVHPVSIPALIAEPLSGHDFQRGRVLAETAAYTRYYITYESGDVTISGIMNVPKGEGPFPVLILNHGYIDPAVYTNGRGLKREQDYLASRGFVVVHPDYRCHAQSDCPAMDDVGRRLDYTRDVMNAVDALQKSDFTFVDREKIGMLGHSMGGGVTQNVIVAKPDLIDAAVLFAPVSSSAYDHFERYTTRRPERAKEVIEKYGTPEASPQFWEDLSSRTFFEHITAPVQIHHGTADADVPLAWSTATERALKDAGKSIELLTYPGQPHEFTSAWGTVMERTVAFFRANLR
jgi:dipeptidyl aminopeptidase/acylaminoacyl peptidase